MEKSYDIKRSKFGDEQNFINIDWEIAEPDIEKDNFGNSMR